MNEYVVKKSITIRATNGEVWEALTNPKITKKYFFNCGVFSTWKEGESITFKGRILWVKKIEMTGRIVRIDPGRLLKYTLQNGNSNEADSFSTITDELKFHHGETILSITDDVGQGDGADKRYRRSMKGWDKVLKGLKAIVEERNTALSNSRGTRIDFKQHT